MVRVFAVVFLGGRLGTAAVKISGIVSAAYMKLNVNCQWEVETLDWMM